MLLVGSMYSQPPRLVAPSCEIRRRVLLVPLCCACALPAVQLSKVEDNWYPGKILMGKQRHEGKVGESSYVCFIS